MEIKDENGYRKVYDSDGKVIHAAKIFEDGNSCRGFIKEEGKFYRTLCEAPLKGIYCQDCCQSWKIRCLNCREWISYSGKNYCEKCIALNLKKCLDCSTKLATKGDFCEECFSDRKCHYSLCKDNMKIFLHGKFVCPIIKHNDEEIRKKYCSYCVTTLNENKKYMDIYGNVKDINNDIYNEKFDCNKKLHIVKDDIFPEPFPLSLDLSHRGRYICPYNSSSFNICLQGAINEGCEIVTMSHGNFCDYCKINNICKECGIVITSKEPRKNIENMTCSDCRSYFTCRTCSEDTFSEDYRIQCQKCELEKKKILCIECEIFFSIRSLKYPYNDLRIQYCRPCHNNYIQYWDLIQDNHIGVLGQIAIIYMKIIIESNVDFETRIRFLFTVRENFGKKWLKAIYSFTSKESILSLLKTFPVSPSYALLKVRWLPQELRIKILGL